ncbi:MAG: bifunctional allantoicase/(S)-ureidoglycine aminohydrolase [Pseudomonadota bacterium]
MKAMAYPPSPGGLPPQTALMSRRALFTDTHAVIPRGTMTDIVTSFWPGWRNSRAWVLARPLTGFAETFTQAIVEVGPGGGAEKAELEPDGESVLFVTEGQVTLHGPSTSAFLLPGSYAYQPPGYDWSLTNESKQKAVMTLIRKAYQRVPGIAPPQPVIVHEAEIEPEYLLDSAGAWGTKRFVDPTDLAHDMHVNIVEFLPGGTIPFPETHVMEHGIYVLEGTGTYMLNQTHVQVEAGDFLWLRAFCPQACTASGPGRFRYLLYKDVNRAMPLKLGR